MAALTDKGDLWLWGDPYQKPIQITEPINKRVVEVACGDKFTAVVTADGLIFSWGDCQYGQLGLGKKKPGAGVLLFFFFFFFFFPKQQRQSEGDFRGDF